MTVKTTQTKESRYRAARLAKGDRLKPVWMTPRTLAQLEQIQGVNDSTLETVVECALRRYHADMFSP